MPKTFAIRIQRGGENLYITMLAVDMNNIGNNKVLYYIHHEFPPDQGQTPWAVYDPENISNNKLSYVVNHMLHFNRYSGGGGWFRKLYRITNNILGWWNAELFKLWYVRIKPDWIAFCEAVKIAKIYGKIPYTPPWILSNRITRSVTELIRHWRWRRHSITPVLGIELSDFFRSNGQLMIDGPDACLTRTSYLLPSNKYCQDRFEDFCTWALNDKEATKDDIDLAKDLIDWVKRMKARGLDIEFITELDT